MVAHLSNCWALVLKDLLPYNF